MSDGPDPDAWLVTFGDLITLLLTFFVLMLSMSSMDNQRLEEAFEHFGGKPGIFEGGEASTIGPPAITDDSGKAEQIQKGIEIAAIVEGALKANDQETISQPDMMLDAKGQVRVKGLSDGQAIVFSGSFMFVPSSAEIRVKAMPVLDSIAKVLRGGTQMIAIQGHTDDQERPFDPRYKDRWDLSAGRAVNVLKYLVRKGRIKPGRLSAVGYGDSRPENPNTSEKYRQQNRRVEVVITSGDLS